MRPHLRLQELTGDPGGVPPAVLPSAPADRREGARGALALLPANYIPGAAVPAEPCTEGGSQGNVSRNGGRPSPQPHPPTRQAWRRFPQVCICSSRLGPRTLQSMV